MTITIKFNDDIIHQYNSFKKILKLDNYNDISYIDCSSNRLSSLPELPNLLTSLWCSNNNLSSLPELPNSLTKLHCNNNNLSILPELPNSLIYIWCYSNNIFGLPELPNSLKTLYCSYNSISSLPELPNSLEILNCGYNNLYMLPKLPNSLIGFEYYDNPIYTHIEKYFNSETKKYFEYKIKLQRIFANKIGNWYLDCKYNPKYLYCRKRLMKEYDELYN